MDLTMALNSVTPRHLDVDQLARNPNLTEGQKIAEVSRHFEAILLRQFLGDATKPMMGGEEGGMSSTMRDIYQDMVVNTLAEQISSGGKFGLTSAFQRQLMPKNLVAPAAAKSVEGGLQTP